jgi:adenine-specific DNA-methyltransferase
MDMHNQIEDRRLLLQSELDAAKTQKERNRLGQFATPMLLADDVLAYAHRLSPRDASVRFLDPAIGTGSFYSALLRTFSPKRVVSAHGFEIDPHYGKPAQALWKRHNLTLTLGDFTTAKPAKAGEKFNLIICNPPYVRHHHMSKEEKARLSAATAAVCGVEIGGLAGLYCYFLGLSHAWLADDGIAGWLIPSEFMDVNYGRAVKQYLLHQVELLRIHRFDPNDLQFGDALISSAVVWFRKCKPQAGHEVEFSYGGTLAKPAESHRVTAKALQDVSKWTGLGKAPVTALHDSPVLGDFFSVKRGLATGNNNFFIMTRAQIKERCLPMKFFRPILPGPRYLETDVIERDRDGAPQIERQHFMLDCKLQERDIKERYPQLWSYLQSGIPDVSKTYLCSHRSPWYSQENRPAPPFLCTYMGRSLERRTKPFRFILNRSDATAANVYLLLYPKPTLALALQQDRDLAMRVWKFLESITSETLLREGRVYGGGLYKMEPKELANVPATAIVAMLPKGALLPAVQGKMFKSAAA